MKSDQTWIHIHAERAAMADTWTELSVDQWTSPSWCDGWSVQDAAGHILAAAEQTPFNFYKKQMAAAGFRFNVFADRAAKRLGGSARESSSTSSGARTTNHPPAPVIAILGEIVVHGEDIRRPLALGIRTPKEPSSPLRTTVRRQTC